MLHLVLLDNKKQEFFKISDGLKTMFVFSTNSVNTKYDKIKKGDKLYFLEDTSKGIIKAKCNVLDKLIVFDKQEAEILLNAYLNELQIQKREIKKIISKEFIHLIEISDFEIIKPIIFHNYAKLRDCYAFKEFNEVEFLPVEIAKTEAYNVYRNYYERKKLEKLKKKEEKQKQEYDLNQKTLEELFPVYVEEDNKESETVVNDFDEENLSEEDRFFMEMENRIASLNLSLEDIENLDLDNIDIEDLEALSLEKELKEMDESYDEFIEENISEEKNSLEKLSEENVLESLEETEYEVSELKKPNESKPQVVDPNYSKYLD